MSKSIYFVKREEIDSQRLDVPSFVTKEKKITLKTFFWSFNFYKNEEQNWKK